MPILNDGDKAKIHAARRQTLRDDLRKPEVYRVGKIIAEGIVEAYPDPDEFPGQVYVRRLGDNVGEAILAVYSGAPLEANSYVEVVPYRGKLRVQGLAPEDGLRRSGVPLRPQSPIDLSQLDYGLLRPTNPPSLRAIITDALRTLEQTVYRTPTLVTKDFTADLPVANAIAVQITLDPTTNTLTYTLSSGFSASLPLVEAFQDFLPKTVSSSAFLIGYVKLYAGQTAITRDDLLPATEIIAKAGGAGGDPFATAIYAPGLGYLVTTDGELVTTA